MALTPDEAARLAQCPTRRTGDAATHVGRVKAVVELDQQSVGRLSRMDAMQQQAMAQAQERSRQRELS